MGVMIALWAAGLPLAWRLRLTRDSRRIVDLVAVGTQLGAGKQTDEADEVPLCSAPATGTGDSRRIQTDFRTPALLERWSPTGVRALMWRDLVLRLSANARMDYRIFDADCFPA
jgi:hypothetical protein